MATSERKERKYQHQYDRHLDTALDYDQIRFYNKYPEKAKKRFPTIDHLSFKTQENGFIGEKNILRTIEQVVRRNIPLNFPDQEEKWRLTIESVQEALGMQLEVLLQGLENADVNLLKNKMTLISRSARIKEAFHLKAFVIQVHEDLHKISQNGLQTEGLEHIPEIQMTGSLITLQVSETESWTLPYSFLLAALDKLESLFAISIYVLLVDSSVDKEGMDYGKGFWKIYDLLEECYLELGNDGIVFFKMLESICLGVCLQSLDPTTNDHGYLTTTEAEIRTSKPSLLAYYQKLTRLLREFLEEDHARGLPIVIEMYGQEKMHFYPIVSQEGGMVTMFRYGTQVRNVDLKEIRCLGGDMKKDYIHSYYNKEGHLPPIVPSKLYHPAIQEIVDSGVCPSMEICLKIPALSWNDVVIEGHQEFNCYPDELDLLDDKAITPNGEHIWQLFADDALEIIGKCKTLPYANTKLVLEILQRPVINIQEFYEEAIKLGFTPKNWAYIQLNSKERELKPDARVYSILTFEARMMCSVCERNIKTTVFKYFPQQSMTSSGPELRQTVDSMANLKEDENNIWVMFHEDFKQWNYTFRMLTQALGLLFLCQIFGVMYFLVANRIFQDSLLFTSSRFFPPLSEEEFTAWSNHAGGNQGIWQSFWTWITLCRQRSKFLRAKLEFYITGAGDNQVSAIKFKKSPNLAQEVTQLRDEIAESFDQIGLTIKVSETWFSSELFAYQRGYSWKGIPIMRGLKQATRAYAGGCDVQSGINMIVMTAMNGGVAMAEGISDPLVGPIFAYMEAYSSLLLHPVWFNLIPHDSSRLAIYSLFNNYMGFLPFSQLLSFLYAGHKDTLCESLSVAGKIWNKMPYLRPLLANCLNFELGAAGPESDLAMVLDPYSLNFVKPESWESKLKTKVEQFLQDHKIVRNRRIRRLTSLLDPLKQQQFAKSLLQIEPTHLSLLHALYQYTVVGQISQMTNRFNKIGSVTKMVDFNNTRKQEETFATMIRRIDTKQLRFIRHRITNPAPVQKTLVDQLTYRWQRAYHEFCLLHNFLPSCLFSARLFLVSLSYEKLPQLILGPFIPSPVDQLTIRPVVSKEEFNHSIEVSPSVQILGRKEELESRRGPFPLYIGSHTKDPVKNIQLTTLKNVETGVAARIILKMHSWVMSNGQDENILQLLEEQLEARIPGLMGVVQHLSSGTAGGNFEHRFDVPGSVTGSFINSTSQISTWYRLSTNHAVDIQRGEEDRFIFFQQLFQHIYSLLRFCSPYSTRFYAIINWDCCSYQVPAIEFHSGREIKVPISPKEAKIELSASQVATVIGEAEHYVMLAGLNCLAGVSKEEALSGFIAIELATRVKSYQLGHSDVPDFQKTGMGPQAVYNVTVMRGLPTDYLLQVIFYHLVFARALGPTNHPSRARQYLKTLLSTTHTLQDIAPFRTFLDGMITAGHLVNLVILSKQSLRWDFEGNMFGLFSVFLTALYNVTIHTTFTRRPLVLLVEAKRSNFNWVNLWRFLIKLSSEFKKWERNNEMVSVNIKLGAFSRLSRSFKLIVTPDRGTVLEYGRHADTAFPVSNPSVLHDPERLVQKPTLIANGSLPLAYSALIPFGSATYTEEVGVLISEISRKKEELMGGVHHISRWNSQASGGRQKLLDIISRDPQLQQPTDLIISLAEGPGSYLSTLLHLSPGASGIYVSLLPPDALPHSLDNSFIPPECLCPCKVHESIIMNSNHSSHYGDLNAFSTWENLNSFLLEHDMDVDFLTWDMEGYSNRKGISIGLLAQWSLLHAPGICVIKLFLQDIQQDYLSEILSIANGYQTTYFIKPPTSDICSSEFFLVCYGRSHPRKSRVGLDLAPFLRSWFKSLEDYSETKWLGLNLELSRWSARCNTCPGNFPSVNSINRGYWHPVEEVLCDVVKVLWASVKTKVLSCVSLERGLQHMLESSARGSDTTVELCMVSLLSVTSYLRSIDFVGIPVKNLSKNKLQSRNLILLNNLIKGDLAKLAKDSSRTRYLKLLGEFSAHEASPDALLVEWQYWIIKYFLEALPNHWQLTSLRNGCCNTPISLSFSETRFNHNHMTDKFLDANYLQIFSTICSYIPKSKEGASYRLLAGSRPLLMWLSLQEYPFNISFDGTDRIWVDSLDSFFSSSLEEESVTWIICEDYHMQKDKMELWIETHNIPSRCHDFPVTLSLLRKRNVRRR